MNSVIKGASYVLIHTPDMLVHNGTTQTTERVVNPDSAYLKELPGKLRSYEDAVSYYPNQTYIGNLHPGKLGEIPSPWYDKTCENADRYGKFGEIMPQEEFLLLLQASDMFGLVSLEAGFVRQHREAFARNPIIPEAIAARIAEGHDDAQIKKLVEEEDAEPLYHMGKLAGCVRKAHDIDINLSSHVMLENLASKASSVLALLYAVRNSGVNAEEVEYVIDCSEEACGDMNQRGGGNLAKAAAEIAGLSGASGSDMRAFCAAPVHAIIEAASLVKSGAYKMVAVTSGGSTAKLGMNGKDHVKKGISALEDCLGGFSVVIGQNDGTGCEINLDMVGRHTVGTGSSPQAVITSLVTDPLDKFGLKVTDIDKFSPEMQNPDITKPAGAGDVPLANYKMIGALAAKRGDIAPKDLNDFVASHGMTGWAPTQGHIPSGAPYIGYAIDDIKEGKVKKAMIIGKGSLFLGRMTNLFDGVSFVIQPNGGKTEDAGGVSAEEIRSMIAKAMRNFADGLLLGNGAHE
ncbi:MAG: DUF5940 domain-containing protein [Synergistaceae bacterium]|nr:DUF5940 domain-containing protein [Synergistaceae bacterium]